MLSPSSSAEDDPADHVSPDIFESQVKKIFSEILLSISRNSLNGNHNLPEICIMVSKEHPLTIKSKRELCQIKLKEMDHLLRGLLDTYQRFVPNEVLEKLTSGASVACGRYYNRWEFTAHCFECEVDSSCIMCMRCFLLSPCRYHHHSYGFAASNSGMCDCGDPFSWRMASFCCVHQHLPNEIETMCDKLMGKKDWIRGFVRGIVQVVGFVVYSFLCDYKVVVVDNRLVFAGQSLLTQLPDSLASFGDYFLRLSSPGSVGMRLLVTALSEKLDISLFLGREMKDIENEEEKKVFSFDQADAEDSSFPCSSVLLTVRDKGIIRFPVDSILDILFLALALQRCAFSFNRLDLLRERSRFTDANDEPVAKNGDRVGPFSSDSVSESAHAEESVEHEELPPLGASPSRATKNQDFIVDFWVSINKTVINCMSDEFFRIAYGKVLMKYFYHSPSIAGHFRDSQVIGNALVSEGLLRSCNFPPIALCNSILSLPGNAISLDLQKYQNEDNRNEESILLCQSVKSKDNVVLRLIGVLLYQLSFEENHSLQDSDLYAFTSQSELTVVAQKTEKENWYEETEVDVPFLSIKCEPVWCRGFIGVLSDFYQSLSSSSLLSGIPVISRLSLRGLCVLLRSLSLWTPLVATVESPYHEEHPLSDVFFFFRLLSRSISLITQTMYTLADELSATQSISSSTEGPSRSSRNSKSFVENMLNMMKMGVFNQLMDSRRLDDISLPQLPTSSFSFLKRLVSLDDQENPFLCFHSSFVKSLGREEGGEEYKTGLLSGIEYIFEVFQEVWRGLERMYKKFFVSRLKGPLVCSYRTTVQTESVESEEVKEEDTKSRMMHYGPTVVCGGTPFVPTHHYCSEELNLKKMKWRDPECVFYVRPYDICRNGMKMEFLPHGPLEALFADVLAYAVVEQRKTVELLSQSCHGYWSVSYPFSRTAYCQRKQQNAVSDNSMGFAPGSDFQMQQQMSGKSVPLSSAVSHLLCLQYAGIPFLNQCPLEYLECLLDSVIIKYVWRVQTKGNDWKALNTHSEVSNLFEDYAERYILLLQLLAGVYPPSNFSARVLERFTFSSGTVDLQYMAYESFLWLICSLVVTPLPDSFDLNCISKRAKVLSVNALSKGNCKTSFVHSWVCKNIPLFGSFLSNDIVHREASKALDEVSVCAGWRIKLKSTELWHQYISLYHFSFWDLDLESVSRNYECLANAEHVWRQQTNEPQENKKLTAELKSNDTSKKANTTAQAEAFSLSSTVSSSSPNFSIPPVEFPEEDKAFQQTMWWSTRRDLLHTAPVQRVCALLILRHAQLLFPIEESAESPLQHNSKKIMETSIKGFLVALHLLYLTAKDALRISKELKNADRLDLHDKAVLSDDMNSTDEIDWELVGDFLAKYIHQPRYFYAKHEEKEPRKQDNHNVDESRQFLEGEISDGKVWDWMRKKFTTEITLDKLLKQEVPEEEVKRYEKFIIKGSNPHVTQKPVITLARVMDMIRKYYRDNKSLDRFSYASMIDYVLHSAPLSLPSSSSLEGGEAIVENQKERRKRLMEKFEKKSKGRHLKALTMQSLLSENNAKPADKNLMSEGNSFQKEDGKADELLMLNSSGIGSPRSEIHFINVLLFKIEKEVCCLCRLGPLVEPLFLLCSTSSSNVLSMLGYGDSSPLNSHMNVCGHAMHFSCAKNIARNNTHQCYLCSQSFSAFIPLPMPVKPSRIVKKRPANNDIPHHCDPRGIILLTENEIKGKSNAVRGNFKTKSASDAHMHKDHTLGKVSSLRKEGQNDGEKKNNKLSTPNPVTSSNASVLFGAATMESSTCARASLLTPPPFAAESFKSYSYTNFGGKILMNLIAMSLDFTSKENSGLEREYDPFLLLSEPPGKKLDYAIFFQKYANVEPWEGLVIGLSHAIQTKMEHLKLNGGALEKKMETLFSFLVAVTSSWCQYLKKKDEKMVDHDGNIVPPLLLKWKAQKEVFRTRRQYFALLIWNIITDEVKRHLTKSLTKCVSTESSESSVSLVDEKMYCSAEEHIEEFAWALLECKALKNTVKTVLQCSASATLSNPHNSPSASPIEEEQASFSSSLDTPSITPEMISLWGSLGCLTIVKLITSSVFQTTSVVELSWPHCSSGEYTLEEQMELVNFDFITLCNTEHLFSHFSVLQDAIVRMMYYLLTLRGCPAPPSLSSIPSTAADHSSSSRKVVGSYLSQDWVQSCLPHLRMVLDHQRQMNDNNNRGTSSTRSDSSKNKSSVSLYASISSLLSKDEFMIMPVVHFTQARENTNQPVCDGSLHNEQAVGPSASPTVLPATGDSTSLSGGSLGSSCSPRDTSGSKSFTLLKWKEYTLQEILHLPRNCIDILEHFYFGNRVRKGKIFGDPLSLPSYPSFIMGSELPMRCCFCQEWVYALSIPDDLHRYRIKGSVLVEHQKEFHGGASGCFFLLLFNTLVIQQMPFGSSWFSISPYVNEFKEGNGESLKGVYTRNDSLSSTICQSWVIDRWPTI